MIRKTTKVDQMGSSSAAASQTEKPMQVTRSGRVKRFRRARWAAGRISPDRSSDAQGDDHISR